MIKAVIHINYEGAKRQAHALGNVQNAREAAGEPTEFEVVCHSSGISLLFRDGNKNAGLVSELIREGVRFAACENTMESKSITVNDLISGVETVPSGALEVIAKQQEGYAYFKP
jgi:intracellular sulfur oxidation DsrE/DsrF family protein